MRTSADIRKANAFDIVKCLHAVSEASRRELVDATGLSFPTVSSICAQLLKRGLLTEVARKRAAAGRPTALLALNPGYGALLGVDIAETYVHVDTLNAALEPVSSTELDVDPHRGSPRDVVARVKEAIADAVGRLDGTRLLGVGVSVPGQVDQAGGRSVYAPNWGWHNVPLLEMLSGSTDAPLYLDNPLKALAIAEQWAHPQRRDQDFVIVNLGTGVGIGAALGGRILRGVTNTAGEWGHTVIVAGGRQCRCGSRGCVEAYVGAAGILQTLRETAPESPVLHGDDQTSTIAAFAEALAAGDPEVHEAFEQTAYYLGVGVAGIVNMLNPEVIVVGGWVARELGEPLLDRARKHIRGHALAVPMMAAALEVQHPRGNSVSLGMAATAMEGYLESLDLFISERGDDDGSPAPGRAARGTG
ncbi:ROK family transcriptional regulator [Actinokineospora soli]